MVYKIMCRTKYGVEEFDSADTMSEAEYLLAEYRLAFYNSYRDLWIEKEEEKDATECP